MIKPARKSSLLLLPVCGACTSVEFEGGVGGGVSSVCAGSVAASDVIVSGDTMDK